MLKVAGIGHLNDAAQPKPVQDSHMRYHASGDQSQPRANRRREERSVCRSAVASHLETSCQNFGFGGASSARPACLPRLQRLRWTATPLDTRYKPCASLGVSPMLSTLVDLQCDLTSVTLSSRSSCQGGPSGQQSGVDGIDGNRRNLEGTTRCCAARSQLWPISLTTKWDATKTARPPAAS